MRIALPAIVDPSSFADCDPTAAVGELAGETMGTTWSVRFVQPAGLDIPDLRERIAARLGSIVDEMSHWQPGTVLSRFNAALAGQWVALPPDFAFVMKKALQIATATDGAFDPAIGRVVNLWGFGPPGPCEFPTAETLAPVHANSRYHRLRIDLEARQLRQPGDLALDLSGIAKGFAVDAVANLLGNLGIGNALVEIGGELVGRGIRPDGEPWWVDLETPPGVDCEPLRVALHGLAVATSGSYRRGDHTIDPRTGWPIDNGIISLSVIAPTALDADAWATALTVLGPDAGLAMAAERHIAARFLVQDGERGRELLSPALEAMLAD